MAKKLSILMVCGAGLGSSFACEMAVESVLEKLGVEAKLNHCDISSASSQRADILITGQNFESQLKHYQIEADILYLKRLVDQKEIEEKLVPVLKAKQAL
jgi:ascorbate PTS system EIIB component